MAITRQRTTFAANKVAQIVTLGLLYTLNIVTNFSIFLQVLGFLTAGHITFEELIHFYVFCQLYRKQISSSG